MISHAALVTAWTITAVDNRQQSPELLLILNTMSKHDDYDARSEPSLEKVMLNQVTVNDVSGLCFQ